jgi:hypothetical protein
VREEAIREQGTAMADSGRDRVIPDRVSRTAAVLHFENLGLGSLLAARRPGWKFREKEGGSNSWNLPALMSTLSACQAGGEGRYPSPGREYRYAEYP